MLTQLLPDQIAKIWPVIKVAVVGSLPPIVGESSDKEENVLAMLLSGKFQCWISHSSVNGTKVANAVVITTIMADIVGGSRDLSVLVLYGLSNLKLDDWVEGFEVLKKWGVANGCSRVVAHTNNEAIVRRVVELGGDASYRFISIPLMESNNEGS